MDIDLDVIMDLSMVMKIRIGDKELVMERGMVLKIRKGQERSIEHQVPKVIPIIPTIDTGNLLSLHHQGGLVVTREVMMEMGGDKGNGGRKKYRNTNYDLGDEDEEESDTEDSFELEITPQQLSQVTSGGGVLKLTLSKRKPLKITTKAPSGEPDPFQTTVKTGVENLFKRMKMVNLIGPQGDKEALMIKAPKEMGMVMENPMGMVA